VNRITTVLIGLVFAITGLPSALAHTPPDNARVFFIGIKDGMVLESPVKIEFGISGFGITPAGTKGKKRHTAGHHHLLVNVPTLPDLDQPIIRDQQHLHYDLGETSTVLELAPGKHTLQLLLGDETHEPQDPPLFSEKITITIK